MLSSMNTYLIVYVTCLNSSVVEHLLSVQEVLGSIPGLVSILYACFHLLPLHHLLVADHAAFQHLLPVAGAGLLITFFYHWSINVYAVLHYSTA